MPRLDLFEISESHLSSSRLDSIFAQNPGFDVVNAVKETWGSTVKKTWATAVHILRMRYALRLLKTG